MESVYLRGSKIDWATDKISLKNYFDKFSEVTKDCFDDLDNVIELDDNGEEVENPESLKIISLTGFEFTNDQLNTLIENCSPDRLAMEGENPVVDVDKTFCSPLCYERSGIPLDVELETFNCLKNRTKAQDDSIFSRLKYKNHTHINCEYKAKMKTPNIAAGEQFIVTVRIYLPFEGPSGQEGGRKQASCSQEVTLLSDETLDELKDVILCMEDFGDAAGDVSENPYAPVKSRLKDVYRSGMFYIGNTFYIDERHVDNIDYSEVVRSWAAKRKIVMNRVEKMETTKIGDLVIRFGYPYLYQHLGDCEHLVVFCDARLLHQDDVRTAEEYPLLKTMSKKHTKHCYICKNNVSKWIVLGCERVTRDPSFVCNACFRLYFYKGKQKNGSFQAFHYFDRRAMV